MIDKDYTFPKEREEYPGLKSTREKCRMCDGSGIKMTQFGEDDVNQDVCSNCDGEGVI